jgi:hypothetical protein
VPRARAAPAALRMGLFDGLFGGSPPASADDFDAPDAFLQRNVKAPAVCPAAPRRAPPGRRDPAEAWRGAARGAQRQDGVWEEFSDPASGQKYYFNTATQETLWEDDFKALYAPPPAPEPAAVQEPVSAGGGGGFGGFGGFSMPAWKRNAQQQAANLQQNNQVGGGVALDAEKLNIKWRQGGGTTMQKGGFGYAYFGTYDARPNPEATPRDIAVVCKLPTTDQDAINAFRSELEINAKIASYGGAPRSLPPRSPRFPRFPRSPRPYELTAGAWCAQQACPAWRSTSDRWISRRSSSSSRPRSGRTRPGCG